MDSTIYQDKIKRLESEKAELLRIIHSNYDSKFLDETYLKLQNTISEYQKRESEISTLLKATQNILETNDFAITAKQIFDSCAKLIGARAGYVALLSDDGHENELLFLEDGGMECTVDPNLPMPIRGLREESYRTGKVVYDNDFMKSEWVKFMPAGHMDLNNVLFSPLNIDGKTVGIMGMACKDGDFDDYDAQLAAAFGNYAAIALRNSKMLEELKNLNNTKDKFFSIITHDLKNPFNVLKGFSSLLLEELAENNIDDSKQYAKHIDDTLNNTMNLLEQLLEWSMLQRGRINFEPAYVNCQHLINEAVELVHPQAVSKDISIVINSDNDHSVFGDRKMLNTILRNLLTNSIKFTNSGGKISVSTTLLSNDDLKIVISDNGIGISEERLEKIFDIESSKSTKGTNNEKGSGLGLILCKEFIKIHSGEIQVKSKISRGTDFIMIFPHKK